MRKIKVLIADNDRRMRNALVDLLNQNFVNLEILQSTYSVVSTVKTIYDALPDIVILDMNLSDGTAIEVVEQSFYLKYTLILMSAYENEALDAIQFAGVDFIYKPLDASDMLLTFDTVLSELDRKGSGIRLKALVRNIRVFEEPKILVLNSTDGPVPLSLDDIIFGESNYSLTKFHLVDGEEIEIFHALRRYEAMLVNYGFYRCHAKYVVNFKYIKGVDYKKKEFTMINELVVPFEERRLENYFKKENCHKNYHLI